MSAPVEVGSTPPNAWGLYEMQGNVSEWCLDEFRGFPKNQKQITVDRYHRGLATHDKFVVRGHSFWITGDECNSWLRLDRHNEAGGFRGFRVALGPVLPPRGEGPQDASPETAGDLKKPPTYMSTGTSSRLQFPVKLPDGTPSQATLDSLDCRVTMDPEAPGDFSRASMKFAVDLRSVTVGNDETERTLKSPTYFDVEKYPYATFYSSSISKKGDGLYRIEGKFKMKTGQHEIAFDARFSDNTLSGTIEIERPWIVADDEAGGTALLPAVVPLEANFALEPRR